MLRESAEYSNNLVANINSIVPAASLTHLILPNVLYLVIGFGQCQASLAALWTSPMHLAELQLNWDSDNIVFQ